VSVSSRSTSSYPIDFDNPADGWDGIGYRIATPYLGGGLRVDVNGNENMTDGEMTGEFRHLFIDLFCNLTEAGFHIQYISEDERNFVQAESQSNHERERVFSVVQKYLDILSTK